MISTALRQSTGRKNNLNPTQLDIDLPGRKLRLSVHTDVVKVYAVELTSSPARRSDRKCTSDVYRAQSSRLCRFRRKSCRAGRWSPSHSTARTAPAGTMTRKSPVKLPVQHSQSFCVMTRKLTAVSLQDDGCLNVL